MGKVVMYGTVSVDGFIADENDQPGPLFDWMSSGDVPLDRQALHASREAQVAPHRASSDRLPSASRHARSSLSPATDR